MVQLLLVGHCTTPSLLDIGQQLRPPVVMGGEVDEISEVSLEIRKFRHVNNFQHLTVPGTAWYEAAEQRGLDVLHLADGRVNLFGSLGLFSKSVAGENKISSIGWVLFVAGLAILESLHLPTSSVT